MWLERRHILAKAIAFVAALVGVGGLARADDSSALGAHVDFALGEAVGYLWRQQRADGSFRSEINDAEAGPTALAVLALLSAGESRTSPEMKRAVEWLHKQNVTATYSLGLRAAALSQLVDPARDTVLKQDVRKLVGNMIDQGPNRGLYTYGPVRGPMIGDLSNSQYGALGMWYAAEAGAEIPRSYWQKCEEAWTAAQHEDGGFPYRTERGSSYGSMTAAGIATLAITNDYLHAGAVEIHSGAAMRVSKAAEAVARAVAWLDQRFRPDLNVGRDQLMGQFGLPLAKVPPPENLLGGPGETVLTGSYIHYMLYGYERVGEATGLTRFNGRRWYADGARYLIGTQSGDGSWTNGTFPGLVDTAYATLFLSRGRSPVLMQKLQFGSGDGWNRRPRDLAAVTRWLRRATERHVNWQVANLAFPFEELREAPILYAASEGAFDVPEAQWHLLKRYLDEGGLLLCADEGNGTFSESVVALFARLYPNYAFRELKSDHLFLAGNFPAKELNVPVKALSNGIRELAVLLPSGDIPGRWQRALASSNSSTPKNPELALVGNILVSISGRANWRNRGEYPFAEYDASLPAAGGSYRVGELEIGSNCLPEPLAWPQVAARMHNAGLGEITPVSVGVSDLADPYAAARYTLVHLTSTHVPVASEGTKAAVRAYLQAGGFLLIDAAGGDPEVGDWAEEFLGTLLPGTTLKLLPADHPLYTGLLSDNGSIAYRASAAERTGGRLAPPRLRGLYQGNRLLALVSTEDLTAGLVGYPHDGIVGYSPEAAQGIVMNLLRWLGRNRSDGDGSR